MSCAMRHGSLTLSAPCAGEDCGGKRTGISKSRAKVRTSRHRAPQPAAAGPVRVVPAAADIAGPPIVRLIVPQILWIGDSLTEFSDNATLPGWMNLMSWQYVRKVLRAAMPARRVWAHACA
jgi:hypothetical protein